MITSQESSPVRNRLLISKDRSERIIAAGGSPIRDKENKILGVVLVLRDITELRRLEEELLRTSKLESVGVLAGGIAHTSPPSKQETDSDWRLLTRS